MHAESPEHREATIVRKVTRRLLPLLILLYTVAYIDRSVVGFAKLQLAADIGLSDTAYGLGAGLFFLGYFLFEVPSNLFLVRVGARRWFARILFSWGAITVAMALIRSPTSFYILRFLLGVAEAGLYPGIVYFLTRWYPQRHLARVLGLFIMAQPVALILTGPLSGALLALDGAAGLRGWQWLFVVSGIPALLLVWPTLRFLPDDPDRAAWLSDADRGMLRHALDRDRADAPVSAHPLRVLRDWRVIRLALAFVPFPVAVYGLTLWLPTILASGGQSPIVTGLLFMLPYCFAMLALFVVPRWSERSGRKRGLILGNSVLAGAAIAGSAMLPGQAWPLAALCVAAFGLYGAQCIFWTLPARLLSGTSAATGIAFINAVGNLGGYVGPFAVGAIRDGGGGTAGGLFFLAGSLLVTIATMSFGAQRDS